MGGWKFTQAPHKTKVICRAISNIGGLNIIGRLGDGRFYVTVPSTGIPKRKYPNSTFITAGNAEPLDAESDGARFGFFIDEHLLANTTKARGYQWRVNVGGRDVAGSVSFNGSVAQAVARLRECTKANSGR